MYNIVLVCSAGMSTSLLVTKMAKSAEEQGIEANIKAVAEADLKNHIDGINVILLGPQVRYILKKVKDIVDPLGIPVDIINSMDYGMMNGDKVLAHAIKLIEEK